MTLTLSPLAHTWILDLDGSIVEHNGYRKYGKDVFLDGAETFLKSLPKEDMVIFLTSRTEEYRAMTELFLQEHGIRYDSLICGAPYGERILVNDAKPSGLCMAYAVGKQRDDAWNVDIRIDSSL